MLGNKPGGKAPSAGIGELAALFRELREMTPKHLAEIEKTTKGFHEAKASADNRIAAAGEAETKLAVSTSAHAEKVRADTEALDQRQIEVSSRESRVRHREQLQSEIDKALTARETAIDDRERRLQRQAEAALELVK